MSTTGDAAQLRTLAIDAIRVDETLNPRHAGDADTLAELTESIRQHGVLQPILVTPTGEEDAYTVIAGHRRLEATRRAGLAEIPAVVRETDGQALELAVIENLQRENLNPIEEARAFERALKSRRLSKKRLAETLSVSPAFVSERLRLLRLPEDVQEAIGKGEIPLVLAKPLEAIAKVSGDVASGCAALVLGGVCKPHELEEQPERVVEAFDRVEWQGKPPFAVRVSGWSRLSLEDLRLPGDEIPADVRERAERLEGGFWFSLGEEDADAARAYGCLLEFKSDRYFRTQFITDPGFLADRLRLHLDAAEERTAEQARWEAEQKRQGDREDSRGEDGSDEDPKEARQAERRAREEARREARTANLELGRKLIVEYGSPKLTKDVARLLALLVLGAHEDLAARGLRYCFEDWQTVERKELKNGSVREKVSYLERWQAQERLHAWIARARTPEEIVGRLLQALIAAGCADQQAVAQGCRVYRKLPGGYGTGATTEIPAIVERLAKRVLPPRLAEQARERREGRQHYAAIDAAGDEEDGSEPSGGDAADETGGGAVENGGRE